MGKKGQFIQCVISEKGLGEKEGERKFNEDKSKKRGCRMTKKGVKIKDKETMLLAAEKGQVGVMETQRVGGIEESKHS